MFLHLLIYKDRVWLKPNKLLSFYIIHVLYLYLICNFSCPLRLQELSVQRVLLIGPLVSTFRFLTSNDYHCEVKLNHGFMIPLSSMNHIIVIRVETATGFSFVESYFILKFSLN